MKETVKKYFAVGIGLGLGFAAILFGMAFITAILS